MAQVALNTVFCTIIDTLSENVTRASCVRRFDGDPVQAIERNIPSRGETAILVGYVAESPRIRVSSGLLASKNIPVSVLLLLTNGGRGDEGADAAYLDDFQDETEEAMVGAVMTALFALSPAPIGFEPGPALGIAGPADWSGRSLTYTVVRSRLT